MSPSSRFVGIVRIGFGSSDLTLVRLRRAGCVAEEPKSVKADVVISDIEKFYVA